MEIFVLARKVAFHMGDVHREMQNREINSLTASLKLLL